VSPVFEQQPLAVHQVIEAVVLVGPEAAPGREVVRSLEDVDRVELQAADALGEADEPRRRERLRAGPSQMLALQEERRDGAQGEDTARHVLEATTTQRRYPNRSWQTSPPTRAIDQPQAMSLRKSLFRSSEGAAAARQSAPSVESGETSTRWAPTLIE
jgi:hypothetical protein